MFSYETYDRVMAGLGDKVVQGLLEATDMTRADLHHNRTQVPVFVAEQSEGNLAGWIRDRLWRNCVRALGEVEEVEAMEKGNACHLRVNDKYLIRVKRHHPNGKIAAREPLGRGRSFWVQDTVALPNLHEVRLAAGYEWKRDTRQIGETVISMRDGINKLVWYSRLASTNEIQLPGSVLVFPTDTVNEPIAPTIEFGAIEEQERGQEES
ncbi:hypothetical protein [Glycomyces algeriensis]|nr:hypothetical protein [Glycomyces algeriensis]MDA1368392.1 hypothetical protein [Glycomyces algeriensis]MDR7353198.1 hypothetical protein [Glycomyces algeriensis]